MNIITEEEKLGRVEDGINTLLSLPEDQFNIVIEALNPIGKSRYHTFENIKFFYTTDGCEKPDNPIVIGIENSELSRYYFGGKSLSTNDIFRQIDMKKDEFSTESEAYKRIENLLSCRSIETYKELLIEEHPENRELLEKLFEMIQNEEIFNKFLSYGENQKEFDVNSQVRLSSYLKYIGKIFGDITKTQFFEYIDIYTNFYVPQIEDIKKRVLAISEKFNVERYSNPKYEFKILGQYEEAIREGNEPEWSISSELKEAVFANMPEDLSLEEKALYIYGKLCKELVYDEGYMYKEKLGDDAYTSDFSKEQLEAIKPGSKVTCFDFSRICSKMINSLDGDIEGLVISQGTNKGHFLAGFYTDKISVRLDPINIYSYSDPTNDIMKAKTGISLKGIQAIFDRKKIIGELVEKVYPLVTGKESLTIQDYVQILKAMPVEQDVPDILKTKLEAFIETMKESNIYGNEFMQLLTGMKKSNFFDEVEVANIGRKDNDIYKRIILIRKKKTEAEENNEKIYSIDTETLKMIECTSKEIIEKMNSGEYVYEDDDHKITGIDKEGQ